MPATHQRPVPIPSSADGLVYVDATMPGLSRVKRGTGFRYRDARGRWLRDADEITRIRSLAIPPAYRDVWICPLHNGHLQATGIDARGRKQYRYHVGWRAMQDGTKFERLEAFGRALPALRRRIAAELGISPRAKAGAALTRERVLAALLRLLDTTFMRVGNEEYANSNGSYGLTTLRNKHVDVHGSTVRLRFRGKSGVMHEASVDDARVARIVRGCQQLPGQELFQYEDSEGHLHGVSSTDVNQYLREIAGGDFSAKDFRTWHGTVQALELTRLACRSNESESRAVRFTAKDILGAVARQLGNTPAVCKKAYVHPAVLALGGLLAGKADEMAEIWQKLGDKTRSRRHLHIAECRLLAFLAQQRAELKKSRRKAKSPAL